SGTTSLAIAANTSSVSTAVQSFVAAYNGLQSTLTTLTKYDATTKTASVLTGDSFQADGTLSLDATRLQSALAADPNAVARLFAAAGNATDASVGVVGTSANTVAGNYAVNITQLATQGTLTGSAAPTLTITTGVNDTLSAVIDGIATTVTLAPGAYANASALGAAVAAKLNATSE